MGVRVPPRPPNYLVNKMNKQPPTANNWMLAELIAPINFRYNNSGKYHNPYVRKLKIYFAEHDPAEPIGEKKRWFVIGQRPKLYFVFDVFFTEVGAMYFKTVKGSEGVPIFCSNPYLAEQMDKIKQEFIINPNNFLHRKETDKLKIKSITPRGGTSYFKTWR